MHHVHISTGFLFVIALFILGIVALIVLLRVDRRRQQERREQREAELWANEQRNRGSVYAAASSSEAQLRGSFATTRPAATQAPAAAVSTTVIVQDTSNDFLSGVMMGEMLSRPPTYMPYEPGPTVHVPDVSACPASPPTSGGFDFSWGNDNSDPGSSCDTGSSDAGSSSDF